MPSEPSLLRELAREGRFESATLAPADVPASAPRGVLAILVELLEEPADFCLVTAGACKEPLADGITVCKVPVLPLRDPPPFMPLGVFDIGGLDFKAEDVREGAETSRRSESRGPAEFGRLLL